MGDLFTLLAIACMSLYLWNQLTGEQQSTLKASSKKLQETVKETVHKYTE